MNSEISSDEYLPINQFIQITLCQKHLNNLKKEESMNIQSLVKELERQKPLKWDKKVSSSQFEMIPQEEGLHFKLPDDNSFPISESCHIQIADKLDIPFKYYRKMEAESPELLIENVNTWLKKKEKDFFLRGLGESIRAFLSDRYRVIDHLDVLCCALNELQAHEIEIEDCYLSETEMNIKVKSQKLQDFVRHREDLIIGGLFFTNSETGHKALRLEPRLFRVKCSNGMIVEEFVTREVHLGIGDTFSDEMTYLSIRRSIRELFSKFGEIIQTLRDSTEMKIRNVQRVINNVVKHYKLSEAQRENILMAFGAEPEHDKFGIANAVTLAAQKEESWEGCVDLEKVGGNIISLQAEEFRSFDEH
ncbi:MAG: DUF932 domain-containing protein [Patescibacteria group bacterium]